MANALTKDLEILFEKFVVGFDAACVISQEAAFMFPDQQAMQRAGDVVYRPQDYHMETVSGLDVSAATPTDLIQRQVPAAYKSPENIVYTLDAKEMRDPTQKEQAGNAAGLRLSAKIDSDLYAAAALQGTNVVKKVGALTWDDGALAEAVLMAKGMPVGIGRKLFLSPFNYKDIAKDLGNRAYLGQTNLDAYERSRVPDIATFRTFRTDNLYNLPAIGTVTGTTLGAAASFTPSAMTGDIPTDNRRMTITVAGANIANIKNGDAFTIGSAGTAVNSVHNITKDDTGNLQTFRVISGGGTASLVITPAILATGPYQNVTQAAGAGANYAQQAQDPNAVRGYMSPYMQNVVDYQKSQALRDFQMGQPMMQAKAVGQGAFGGNRMALQQAEAGRGLMSQLQGIEAQGAQAAFDKATQAQQYGSTLGLQGLQTGLQGYNQALNAGTTLGQLGQTQYGQQMGILQGQNQFGQQQQQMEQQKINQAISDYSTAQQYPMMQLGFMSNMLRGLPMQSVTTQQYQAQPPIAQQAAGLGLGALGAYKAFS